MNNFFLDTLEEIDFPFSELEKEELWLEYQSENLNDYPEYWKIVLKGVDELYRNKFPKEKINKLIEALEKVKQSKGLIYCFDEEKNYIDITIPGPCQCGCDTFEVKSNLREFILRADEINSDNLKTVAEATKLKIKDNFYIYEISDYLRD